MNAAALIRKLKVILKKIQHFFGANFEKQTVELYLHFSTAKKEGEKKIANENKGFVAMIERLRLSFEI